MTAQTSSRAAVAVVAALLMTANAFAQTLGVPRTRGAIRTCRAPSRTKTRSGLRWSGRAEFEGRRIEDITPAEVAAILKKRHDDRPRVQADASGRIGPTEWQSQVDLTNGSRLWFVTSPPDGKIPPLTVEARARAVTRQEAQRGRGPADSWLDLDLGARCITQGVPGSMMPGTSGNSYEIVQAPGYVVIRYERINETRVIPLDGRPHANVRIRAHMGDARGRFQGDVLVVETTNFRDESAYREANPDRLRVVERFTPKPDGRLEWSVTLEDPSTWTGPWTFSMVLTPDSEERIIGVRVPRGKPRDGEHAERGARGGTCISRKGQVSVTRNECRPSKERRNPTHHEPLIRPLESRGELGGCGRLLPRLVAGHYLNQR